MDQLEANEVNHKEKWLAISWAPYSRRSAVFASEIGGELYTIQYLRFKSPKHAPLKYFLQALRTMQVLIKQRPGAIHVQMPPFVAGLVVDLYCRITGAKFVLDYHSAAFGSIWDWALPVQKYLARRAVANTVTNQHWAEIIESWQAKSIILGDAFRDLPPGSDYPVSGKFNIAYICTYSADEPLEEVVEACRNNQDLHVYITGNPNKVKPDFMNKIPPNVTLTGFLPDEDYIGLLRGVDGVMALTTRDYTLQRGGCEAVAVGQPLITSDWPFLREFFNQGTVHVENDSEGIKAGFEILKRDHQKLRKEVVQLRRDGRILWDKQLSMLKEKFIR
jgi:glycosyltransferase involved in cell wall biosynthesis